MKMCILTYNLPETVVEHVETIQENVLFCFYSTLSLLEAAEQLHLKDND